MACPSASRHDARSRASEGRDIESKVIDTKCVVREEEVHIGLNLWTRSRQHHIRLAIRVVNGRKRGELLEGGLGGFALHDGLVGREQHGVFGPALAHGHLSSLILVAVPALEPRHIDVDELREALSAVDGVTEVHDLHVWTLVPGKDMVTAHLTSTADAARVLSDARAVMTARGLDHATVQVEPPDGAGDCRCDATW